MAKAQLREMEAKRPGAGDGEVVWSRQGDAVQFLHHNFAGLGAGGHVNLHEVVARNLDAPLHVYGRSAERHSGGVQESLPDDADPVAHLGIALTDYGDKGRHAGTIAEELAAISVASGTASRGPRSAVLSKSVDGSARVEERSCVRVQSRSLIAFEIVPIEREQPHEVRACSIRPEDGAADLE